MKNPIAKEVRTPKFRPQVVVDKKKYSRKKSKKPVDVESKPE